MREVYWIEDAIFCPLGDGSNEVYDAILAEKTSLAFHSYLSLSENKFYASLFSSSQKQSVSEAVLENNTTFFEKIAIKSIRSVLEKKPLKTLGKTAFILATTKGNIECINNEEQHHKLPLSVAAQTIAKNVGIDETPFVISNACISGIAAIIMAKRLLQNGLYDSVIVCGADVITDFVASGFQSLHATANEICRPYDKNRTGINLGEAACSILFSTKLQSDTLVKGGSITNDANHLSGPSKTGEELAIAIENSLRESMLSTKDIGFISAHGTATVYNDEMESKAFALAWLSEIPVNSLKPHFGHTLGAAGIIETIINLKALNQEIVLPTLNTREIGVSGKINVATQKTTTTKKCFLKTASGFGGCNTAIIISKT